MISIDLMRETSINDNSSFLTTEIFANFTDVENLSNETLESRSIYLENLTENSELETATAMPFLFDWFTPKYTESQSEPRKYSKKIENIPRPFYHVLKDPVPTEFYSTVNRNMYNTNREPSRHKVTSIQDIIKYLEKDDTPKPPLDYKGVKFAGKFEMNTASNKNSNIINVKTKKPKFARLMDPFYHYKPQNPGDINLLAPNTYRFSPYISLTTEKYPTYEQIGTEEHLNYNVKPVSLLLDIYPVTNSQNENKNHLPDDENVNFEHETQNQIPFGTKIVPKIPSNYKKPNNANYNQAPNKMVFHLNLYPKPKFLPQNRRNNPYFINRRISTKQRPYYNHIYNKMSNSKQFRGKLLQNEEYINQNYIRRPFGTKIIERKYITRNLTGHSELNDHIRPVSEPTLEVANLEELEIQSTYNYSNNDYLNTEINKKQDINKNQNNIISTIKLDVQNEAKEKLINSEDNQILKGSKEELQKILFSTLPPHILHNKHYTTSTPDQDQAEWDYNELEKNPNLINHKCN